MALVPEVFLKEKLKPGRSQSFAEEIANSISHGLGLFVCLLAVLPILVVDASRRNRPSAILGVVIFGITLALVYLSSAIYHALPEGRAKRLFHALDHSAIFLLIAGTYTPFTLGVLRGAWGWSLLTIVWGIALLGIGLKMIGGVNHTGLFVALYVSMGWLALIALKPIFERVPCAGIAWIFAGGLAYTFGLAFFAADRLKYNHFVWHIFVMVGSACHFVAVLRYSH